MKELLETLDAWRATRVSRRRPRRGRAHVRVGAAAGGRGPARTRRTAGSRARSAAAASRAPRPRRSRRPARPAAPGSSATASATSRRGTSASPAAARSTCSSSRPCRRPRSRRRAASLGAGGPEPPSSRHSPATRRRPTFGPHDAGRGARRPRPELVVHDDGRLDGTLGDADARRGARGRGRARRSGAAVADRRARRPLAVRRGVPGPAAARRRRRGRGRPLARPPRRASSATRPSSSTAGRRSRPPERFPDVDRLVVGWPDEVADEIGLGPNDAVAVLTHDVKFDEPAIVEALRRGCRYVGAVGSRKTQADRRERLLEAGRDARASSPGCAARSASTSAGARRPRPRSRSSPRSSPSATAAPGVPMRERAIA